MIPTGFRIEPADYTADLADLRAVREPVFIVEQKVPEEEEWDDLDPRSHHVLARDESGRPIGTGRLTPEHKIGRMAVLREWRGKGVGDGLLVALLDRARGLGWDEVKLNAQVQALPFYARHGFEPYGERFMEAGIEHQAMRRRLEPLAGPERYPARARGESVPATEFDTLHEATEATLALVGAARRELVLFSRDLDPVLYGQPAVVEAFKQYAIAGRGGVVRVILLDPAAVQGQGHPLLTLAQRMTTAFQFRTPVEDVDQQLAFAFLANDRDGYLYRPLASRWDGEWSRSLPARARQVGDQFGRVWERSRACSEFRALGI